nr:unnamed protein product [Spirometra erinaceieuropaei]
MESLAECTAPVVPSCEWYPDWSKHEVSTGTTLVACKFDDGVVIGADSRTSSGDDLLAGIFVAGWDSENGGQIYSIPVGGMLIKQPAVIGGSGSTYLYGHFDSELKPNMTKQEAIAFVSKCVGLAINRDGSSGGCIRLGIISSEGVERRLIKGNEVPLFSYRG